MTTGAPGGAAYDWYQRGRALHASGDAAAAAQLFQHAVTAEPEAHSVREALARALFDSGDFASAREVFQTLTVADPVDDYARYGLGMSLRRLGEFREALEPLALAVAMRPDNRHYAQALRETRATLASRL